MLSLLKAFCVSIILVFIVIVLYFSYTVGTVVNAQKAQVYSRDYTGAWAMEFYPKAPGVKTMNLSTQVGNCSLIFGPEWKFGNFHDEGGTTEAICWKRVAQDERPENDIVALHPLASGEQGQTITMPIQDFTPVQ
jgi:hypothetical protein